MCGLKPNEVLDLNFDTFNAVVEGYTDRVFDQQLITVQTGYWSGYYSNSKHPKSADSIMMKMIDSRRKSSKSNVSEIDVEEFLRREEAFNARLSQLEE